MTQKAAHQIGTGLRTAAQPMELVVDAICERGTDSWVVVADFARALIRWTGLTIEHEWWKEFPNGSEYGPGITYVAVLAESSLVIHTRPEERRLNLNLHSCRRFDAQKVESLVIDHFHASLVRPKVTERPESWVVDR